MSTPKYATIPAQFSIHSPTSELSSVIQKRLFEHDFEWNSSRKNVINHSSEPWINVGYVRSKTLTHHVHASCNLILTVAELFEIPLPTPVAPVPPKEIKHSLPWKVTIETGQIKLGCQTLSLEDFSRVVKEIKKSRPEVSSALLSEPWYIEPITQELSEVIQKKLFETGYRWNLPLPVEDDHTKVDNITGVIFSESVENKTFDAYSIPGAAADGAKVGRIQLTVEDLFAKKTKRVVLEDLSIWVQEDGLKADGRLIPWEQVDAFLAQL